MGHGGVGKGPEIRQVWDIDASGLGGYGWAVRRVHKKRGGAHTGNQEQNNRISC